MKKITLMVICAIGLLLMSGCSGAFEPSGFVKGNLDVVYLGQISDEFLEMQGDGSTKESLAAFYEEGMETVAGYYAEYFQIETVTDETKAKLMAVCKELYGRAKYSVGENTADGDGYIVPVTIEPVDCLKKVMDEDIDAYLEDFEARMDSGEFDDMTDEEYEDAWAAGIIELLQKRIDSAGYEAAVTVEVKLVMNDEELYTISDESMTEIDTHIVALPE